MGLFSITSKAESWKALASALVNVSEEGTLYLTDDGIKSSIMDASHVTVLDMFWSGSNMDNLTLGAEQSFGFRTDDLLKIIKRFDSDDIINVQYTDEKKLKISKGIRVFNMSIMIPKEKTKIPKLEYDVILDCSISNMKQALDDCIIFDNDFMLKADSDGFYCTVREAAGDITSPIPCNITKSLNISTYYGLEYIRNMIESMAPYVDTVHIEFSEQKPLKMTFDIPGSVHIEFYVAPKNLEG